jgi:hypothetical protein
MRNWSPESFSIRLPPFTEAARFLLQGRFPDSQVVAFRSLPIPDGTVASIAKKLAAYSGGTVRDLHPLPSLFAVDFQQNPEASKSYHACPKVNPGGSTIT